jgi:hypothetical protein
LGRRMSPVERSGRIRRLKALWLERASGHIRRCPGGADAQASENLRAEQEIRFLSQKLFKSMWHAALARTVERPVAA